MLPSNLHYGGNRNESSMARSYTSMLYPNGSLDNYKSGTVCTILIPTRQNLTLCTTESVLNFNATIIGTDNTNFRFDSCGAHGFIQRIRIYHGSNLLEDIDNYNMLAKEIFDLQVSTDASQGKYSILAGTRQDLITKINGTAAGAAFPAQNLSANYINSGMLMQARTAPQPLNNDLSAGNNTRNFSITLISILGTLCNANYLPLFAMTSSDIRLEITFVSNPRMAGCSQSAITDFQIDKVSYIGSFIELSDSAMGIIAGSLKGKLMKFTTNSYANYTYAQAVNTNTQINFNIAAKYMSLKSLIVSTRDSNAGVSVNGYYPLSSCLFNLNSYQFKIGNLSVPTIPPNTVSQMFGELIRTFGSMSDINYQPSIDIQSYSILVPTSSSSSTIFDGSVNSGSFYIGLDLENYQGSSASGTNYVGYNTTNDNIYLQLYYGSMSTPIDSMRFDAFAMFDQELIFENGVCYRSF